MLITLNCPKCRENLEGANNSKLFFCKACNLVYDVSDSKPKRYDLFYISPKIKREHSMIYFPFWQIYSRYQIRVTGKPEEDFQARLFYVPAFFIKNINYFGDIGYYIMANNIVLKTGEKADLPVFPGDRGLSDSIVYPRIYLVMETAQKSRNEEMDINIDHKEVSVALIPFYQVEKDFYDSVINWKYPSGALI